MKILSRLFCSDSEIESSSHAEITLTPSEARGILDASAKTIAFVGDLAAGGVVSTFFSPSLGLRCFPFRPLNWREEIESLMGDKLDEELVTLADGVDIPEAWEGDRVECFRVKFAEDHVVFSALAKNGSHSYETARIPHDLLRKIAAGE